MSKERKERAYVSKKKKKKKGGEKNAKNYYILCYEHVVHADDVDLVDPLRLELVVLFYVSRCLRMTRGREGSRHTNLFRVGSRIQVRVIYH